MLTALVKSEIFTVKPVRQDKYDGGQFEFLQTIIANMADNDYIYFSSKEHNKKMHQESTLVKKVRDFIASGNLVINGKDVFVAPNSYANDRNRQKNNIRHLNAFFIDIDYQKVSKYKKQAPQIIVKYILHQCKQHEMPLPSFIVSTGHGLHIWWMLTVPVDSRFIRVWDEIQNQIYLEFKSFGADSAAKDGSRYLRVPGTINAKNEKEVREVSVAYVNPARKYVKFSSMYRWAARHHEIVWLGNLRTISTDIARNTPLHIVKELVDSGKVKVPARAAFKPFIPNEPANDISIPSAEVRVMRRSRRTETEEECSRRHQVKAMSVNPMRLDDLGTLVTIRKGHMTGQRELFLHHYRNTLARCGIYGQKQEQKIREMNSQFTEPLPEYEIKNILKQYKLYMAKNETIIRDLAITPAEQTMMRTIYGPEEKERRRLQKNKCGMSGEERIKSTCAKIMKYLALGKSNSEIAALLSCTTRTVRNYIHKFDLLGKGAAFCAGKISDIVTPEEPYHDTDENNKAVESAAKTYTNDVVDDMKRKAGKTNKPKPRKLNKKEKASLVSKILTLLESQIPDFWAKIQKVADDFFKERDARLLIKTEGKKNRYTKLFRRLLLGSVPGYYVPNHTNGLVLAFMEALYAA